MHLYRNLELAQEKSKQMENTGEFQSKRRSRETGRLRATAVVLLGLMAGMPSGFGQQAAIQPGDKVLSDLPVLPTPIPTEPLYLRPTARDFSKPYAPMIGNPFKVYGSTSIPKASFTNSVRLNDLVRDGKIYLSLSDALALALENNYDIAIARYDLDIADTDILRAKAGGPGGLLGAPSGLLTGTLSGGSSTLT